MNNNIELKINGEKVRVNVSQDKSLLNTLREDLDLTGSKYGCGEGQCGACTVLIDGVATKSCLVPVGTVKGKDVTTIEGLEKNNRLHPVQEAFIEMDAMQCGYCIPGMIMSGVALLKKKNNPTEKEIMQSMEGNICRCGTYQRIVTAISKAAKAK
jgi:aerobic-type carbon monoxide dehydrogenase small subunit (CoxS/CutS family)